MARGLEIVKERIDAILSPASPREQEKQEAQVRSSFLQSVRRALRHVPFMEDVVASYHCALDPQTPAASKGILLAALAYFVMPIDIVPDFIVGLGFTDDVAVLLAAFKAVQNNIRPEHYDKARETLGEMEKRPTAPE
ncbi:YkvA family protein [Aureimonas psammosilenae]|uniref:YkvA family protein n=1 Tax=Aureimonas psammosilenae TaxID=2495496 RepID=UPI001260FE04|nr:YkvA family protein [Aureimonas psammosilenae]